MTEVLFVLENFSVDFGDALRDYPNKEVDFKLCLIAKIC
jgi:hypothetical protein